MLSQKTNPTVIGTFVLVGIGIALAAGLILSSGRWFKETYEYVMVFEGNVAGLLPGAPVQYRGVTIGSVKEVKLVVNRQEGRANVPVIVEFDPSLITFVGGDNHGDHMSNEIQAGLRAQLESQSLVTGLQKIMLVDRPDVPIQLRNMLDLEIPEIPTAPNLGQSLVKELQALPLAEIVTETHSTLKNLNTLSASLAKEDQVKTLQETLVAVRDLSQTLNNELPEISKELISTSQSTRALLENLEPVGASMSEELPTMLAGLDNNLSSFLELQNNLNKTLGEIQLLLNRNSTSRYQITDSLAKFSELAVQASQFLDYLERHPESLITGKPQ
jgi:paraquat-inducible protein B